MKIAVGSVSKRAPKTGSESVGLAAREARMASASAAVFGRRVRGREVVMVAEEEVFFFDDSGLEVLDLCEEETRESQKLSTTRQVYGDE